MYKQDSRNKIILINFTIGKFLNIQTSKIWRWAINKVFFLSNFKFALLQKLGWKVWLHFKNNILKSPELFQSIHLILPKGLCATKVGTPYPNEGFPCKGKQTPTNNGPPHNGRQRSPKKWHYMGHWICFCVAYCLRAMCSHHEYKDKQKIKHQGSCGKLAYHVYSTGNVNFACKTPSQAL